MRKNIKKFAGIVLCIGMFTGCAQTPDSSLVKPKGSKAVDAYTEADDVSGSKGEASESKNDDGSESKTTIRNLIDAPQNYKSHVEDDSAKLVVNTDASVDFQVLEYDIEVRDPRIAMALKKLTERKRDVILLYFFMDMNDVEIAESMNLVCSTVCEHRKRSLEILKEILKEAETADG